MSIETNCRHCGTKLTVSSEFQNSEVRCPQCDYVFRVKSDDHEGVDASEGDPLENEATAVETLPESSQGDGQTNFAGKASPTEWYLRIPEGRVYGPVSRIVLDNWVAEGRVSSDCGLRNDVDEGWNAASETYPMLVEEEGNPFAAMPLPSPTGSMNPHRGKLIFFLAIGGCIVPFVSFWPAIMGTRDLRQMNLGKMDPSGDVLTRAGQAIAMVSSMIWGGTFGIAILVLLIRLVGSA